MSDRPGTLLAEEIDSEIQTDLPWNVILYNDDWHPFDEVILQVQKATGVSLEKSVEIVLEAHNKGRAVCYSGSLEECLRVANILKEIKLHVEIDQPTAC
ncbi:MAG: ATP-dependent Clp protease adaptor ClpS [Nitrospirae bacterium]|nr:ATP-dependent Clp protease adaptor ClpS [Nitrospirota bacterium]MBI3605870.1 ATP-dependent Clp protease adaptor ClpS [Nitrospirota bacterium]